MRILTIGGYGFTEREFLRALLSAEIETFVDVRQRRGMRGAKYAFLNSKRLQSLLASQGIKYIHALDLAPTTSVRDAQKANDRMEGFSKQDRTQLAPTFVNKYRSEILSVFDPESLRQALDGTNAVAFFCVEARPTACHRSLAAEHIANVFGSKRPVEHLHP